ncbi:MAG: FkbM family methyltransferase [Lacipirellulaceae bacterium]
MSYSPLHRVLNTLLPMPLRIGLRKAVAPLVPSLRHLDMPVRLRHLRTTGFEARSILDVGAASGDWVRLAASIWPDASVFGIEPNLSEKANLEATRRAVPRFDYVFGFAGPERKTIRYTPSGHQTTLTAGSGDAAPDEGAPTAEVYRIDDLVAEGRLTAPDFIKADVQGYELEVLRGASECLRTSTQAVLLEVSMFRFEPPVVLVDEVIAFMVEAGFAWYDVAGILRRKEDDALGQMDLLFLRRDHPLRTKSQAAW